ncbi:putative N-acetylated-alpha-linked acidic dipeptidase [Rhinatrema bivittatum]|uniref:putative N-acetylated-alpha-linked acidic dipeptidase n=1 Tax=Rhinatrema bivittatum TaxID=194408 RepID=UPI001129708E|nr:putative N-acetylated-alpha-linked acidic dipeptidase [Rhinatrema bivittatum]
MVSTFAIKVAAATLGGICLLSIGIVIGRFALAPDLPSWLQSMSSDGNPSNSQRLMKEIQAENIRKNLEFFSKKPHIAGSQQEEVTLATHIHDTWKEYLDGVRIYTYNVLLSYPNASDPNYVAIWQENGTETEQSSKKEKILTPDQDDPTVVNPFNAYSPAGDVLGDLVYVNYGTIEDFMYLTRNLSMNLTGTVAIVRYGKIFRGDKVRNGETYGCAGMIIYSDPADYVVGSNNRVFPDDWWLPGTGAQRGTVLFTIGDPLTPFYPSIESAYYLDEKEIQLPLIPVTPIGYDDAVKYLSKMAGEEVQSTWQGKLNITYRVGPGFLQPHEKSKIKLYVRTYNVKKPIKNVIGFIQGNHEPDRYVVLGNHRDAWVFGAIDPSSATAAMMEVSRAMGQLLKDGWRPRRSIIFCSWGAEEYGLIGSMEWAEEMSKILGSRTIAYLNVDVAVEGNTSLLARATPILHNLLHEASKKVENPNPEEIAKGRRMVYDTWLATNPSAFDPALPHIGDLGSGSDYAPFLQILGISSLDITYTYDKSYSISSYPMYHSVYETYDLVSRLMDRDFKYHQAVARLWGEMALTLADNVILMFDCQNYAVMLEKILASIKTSYGTLLQKNGINLDDVTKATEEFKKAASILHKRIEILDIKNPLDVRRVNDQLMQMERAFIDSLGVASNPSVRHVIYAPNQHNSYASSSFPGLAAALFDIENQPNQTESWKKVKKEISIITFSILSAASTLKDVNDIGGL